MEWLEKQLHQEKGFTLVEIIVVLVVLAILAAFTIPAMLGFVENAKAKAYIAEAREVYVAAQAVATEYTGTGQSLNSWSDNFGDALSSYWVSGKNDAVGKPSKPASLQMKKYLEKDLTIAGKDKNYASADYGRDVSYWYVMVGGSRAYPDKPLGTVQEVYYVKNDYVVWYSEGQITVEKLKTPADRPPAPWLE